MVKKLKIVIVELMQFLHVQKEIVKRKYSKCSIFIIVYPCYIIKKEFKLTTFSEKNIVRTSGSIDNCCPL